MLRLQEEEAHNLQCQYRFMQIPPDELSTLPVHRIRVVYLLAVRSYRQKVFGCVQKVSFFLFRSTKTTTDRNTKLWTIHGEWDYPPLPLLNSRFLNRRRSPSFFKVSHGWTLHSPLTLTQWHRCLCRGTFCKSKSWWLMMACPVFVNSEELNTVVARFCWTMMLWRWT